jgi:DNA topoisomerase I
MDSESVAREAGLRYIDDRRPGITRRRRGPHFVYYRTDGAPLRDRREVDRIKALAIPPAYTDVWISPIANGHIQATGRDARGRKQYRYHARWRAVRDESKYHRLVDFGRALPAIRKAVANDLQSAGLSRRKVLAAIVAIMDSTGVRVGNEEYVRANGSFGITTLRARHASIQGSKLRLRFRGKTGREHSIALDDRRLVSIVRRCRDLPGEDLFGYVDDSGAVSAVSSDDVNAYLHDVAGGDFSAKDFRTWIGTVECIAVLAEPADNAGEAKHRVAEALARVAARLGNTPAVCRKAYVHPAVIETYLRDLHLSAANRASAASRADTLSREERIALRLVRRLERQKPRTVKS